MVVDMLMQIPLICHRMGDILLIMIHYISFVLSLYLSSVCNYPIFVSNVYGGTSASTYTDAAGDTTNLTLSDTTEPISITHTSAFQYIVLICYPLSNSICGYSTNNYNGFYC